MSIQSLDEDTSIGNHCAQTPLQQCIAPQMLKKSIYVAVVVGTVLTIINHGDKMMAGLPLNMTQVLLTYLVPFLVSTYGAWNMARSNERSG
jgi:hypothetical protein